MNSDQYRGGTEPPPPQNRNRFASNISNAPRLRQTSALASPHDRPSQPTYQTVLRAIPGARPSLDEGRHFPISAGPESRPMKCMQRPPEEMRQGISIPRGPNTPEEGPRGTPSGCLNLHRALGNFNSGDERQSTPVEGDLSDVSDDDEQLIASWETEAWRKEEEARHLGEKARQSLEEAGRLKACARQAEAKKRSAEILRRKEVEARHREDNVRRKEEDVRQREILTQQKEEEARCMEENARRSWVEAKSITEDYKRKKREIERRGAELKKSEADFLRKEQVARQAKESSRFEFKEPARDDEDTARLKVKVTTTLKPSPTGARLLREHRRHPDGGFCPCLSSCFSTLRCNASPRGFTSCDPH